MARYDSDTYAAAFPFKEFYVRGEGLLRRNVESLSDFVTWCARYTRWWHDQRVYAGAHYVVPCWVDRPGLWQPAGILHLVLPPVENPCPEFPKLRFLYQTDAFHPALPSAAPLVASQGRHQLVYDRDEFFDLVRALGVRQDQPTSGR